MRVLDHSSVSALYEDLCRCHDGADKFRIAFIGTPLKNSTPARVTVRDPRGENFVSVELHDYYDHIRICTGDKKRMFFVRDGGLHECEGGWIGFVVRIDAEVMEHGNFDDLVKKMHERTTGDNGARYCLRQSSIPGLYTYSMPWKLVGARKDDFCASSGFLCKRGPKDEMLEIGLDYEGKGYTQPSFCTDEHGNLIRQWYGDRWEIVALEPDDHVSDLLNPGDCAELPSDCGCNLFCDMDGCIYAQSLTGIIMMNPSAALQRLIDDANNEIDITGLLDGDDDYDDEDWYDYDDDDEDWYDYDDDVNYTEKHSGPVDVATDRSGGSVRRIFRKLMGA